MPFRFALAVVMLAVAWPALSEVYRWVDDEGNVIFSDTPREGAEKVELGETTVVPAVRPPPPPPRRAARTADTPKPYESVAISNPPSEATLRNVQGVNVGVAVTPALQTEFGHTLQLWLDGAAVGPPAAKTSFVLPEVHRGAHELQAAVLDESGNELMRSAVSVFFLHRTSLLNPGPAGASAP